MGTLGTKRNQKEKKIMNRMLEWDFSEKDEESKQLGYELYCNLQKYFEEFYEEFSQVDTVSGQMKGVTDQIRDVSENVKEASEYIAKGSTAQAEDIEKCRQVADELATQIGQMSEQYQTLIRMAEEMSNANATGKQTVDNLSEQQKTSQGLMEKITGNMNQLVSNSQHITEITDVLYSIANQTNLLALNASIEAARAGESGRGFAVVAEQVRKLSIESKEASQNINDSIKDICREMQQLKLIVDQSQESFSAQEEAVATVVSFFGEIDQYTGTSISCQRELMNKVGILEREKENLLDSITNIANVIEESSATTEEVASLTITQNSVVNLMDKMSLDLRKHVDVVRDNFQNIKISRSVFGKKKIAMVFDLDIPFYKVTENEARKTAQILNMQLDVFAPKSRSTSIEEMTEILEKVVSEGYDGLVISPVSSPRIEELLRQGHTDGMKIIFLNAELPGIPYESVVTSDGVQLGITAARTAKKAMNGNGLALVLSWNDVHISAIEKREEGFMQEMQGGSACAKKVPVPSAPSESEAETIISGLIRSNPDTKLIYATNADWGCLLGKYFSRHRSDIKVISIDYVKEMESFIQNGAIDYAIAQRNFVWGSVTMEGLAKLLEGDTMERYVDTGSYEVNINNYVIYENRV